MGVKCIIYGCENYTYQGKFTGSICTPCFNMITTGNIGNGNTFIHKLYAKTQKAVIGKWYRVINGNDDNNFWFKGNIVCATELYLESFNRRLLDNCIELWVPKAGEICCFYSTRSPDNFIIDRFCHMSHCGDEFVTRSYGVKPYCIPCTFKLPMEIK